MKLDYAGDIEKIAEDIIFEDERAYYNVICFDVIDNEVEHDFLNDTNECDYSKRIEYFTSGTTGMDENEKLGVIITRLEEQLEMIDEEEKKGKAEKEEKMKLEYAINIESIAEEIYNRYMNNSEEHLSFSIDSEKKLNPIFSQYPSTLGSWVIGDFSSPTREELAECKDSTILYISRQLGYFLQKLNDNEGYHDESHICTPALNYENSVEDIADTVLQIRNWDYIAFSISRNELTVKHFFTNASDQPYALEISALMAGIGKLEYDDDKFDDEDAAYKAFDIVVKRLEDHLETIKRDAACYLY